MVRVMPRASPLSPDCGLQRLMPALGGSWQLGGHEARALAAACRPTGSGVEQCTAEGWLPGRSPEQAGTVLGIPCAAGEGGVAAAAR